MEVVSLVKALEYIELTNVFFQIYLHHTDVLWTVRERGQNLNQERSRQKSACPFKPLGLLLEKR